MTSRLRRALERIAKEPPTFNDDGSWDDALATLEEAVEAVGGLLAAVDAMDDVQQNGPVEFREHMEAMGGPAAAYQGAIDTLRALTEEETT